MTQEEINQIECFPEIVENKPLFEEHNCPHIHQIIKILATYCTCEVTAVFCEDCGKQLTKEKWEC